MIRMIRDEPNWVSKLPTIPVRPWRMWALRGWFRDCCFYDVWKLCALYMFKKKRTQLELGLIFFHWAASVDLDFKHFDGAIKSKRVTQCHEAMFSFGFTSPMFSIVRCSFSWRDQITSMMLRQRCILLVYLGVAMTGNCACWNELQIR